MCPEEMRVTSFILIYKLEAPRAKKKGADRLLQELYDSPRAHWSPAARTLCTTLSVQTTELDPAFYMSLYLPPYAFRTVHIATLAEVHRRWLAIPKKQRPRHPLEPLIETWQDRSVSLREAHLLVTQERRPPPKQEHLLLGRTPGVLALICNTTLEAVEVDGETLVTSAPDGELRRRYRVQQPEQGELFAAPRTLETRATGGILVEAVARLPLTGDERTPLRAHLLRLGSFAYALTNAVTLTTSEGAMLLTGRDTPKNCALFMDVMWQMRSLAIEGRPGELWAAADAEPGDPHRIGPPRWWLSKSGLRSYRLTGILFRRIKGAGRHGTRWGALERTIAGIEGALLWGKTAGRGRGGRLPDAVRPLRIGGPGPVVFTPWWQVLRLAGDHVPADLTKQVRNTLGQRYKGRVDRLKDVGYFTSEHGTASARDTVEIVRRVRPGRGHEAGIMVRATARLCAAYAGGGERVRVPASRLIDVA